MLLSINGAPAAALSDLQLAQELQPPVGSTIKLQVQSARGGATRTCILTSTELHEYGIGIDTHWSKHMLKVTTVAPFTPAQAAGIHEGDEILRVNGKHATPDSTRLFDSKYMKKDSYVDILILHRHDPVARELRLPAVDVVRALSLGLARTFDPHERWEIQPPEQGQSAAPAPPSPPGGSPPPSGCSPYPGPPGSTVPIPSPPPYSPYRDA